MDADELKAWRLSKGLSQSAAGALFNKSERSWQGYEGGATPVPKDVEGRIVMLADQDIAKLAAPDAPELVTETPSDDAWSPDRLFRLFREVLRPYPASNTTWGASASWDTRAPKPGWKRVPGCCRIVCASIPDPIPFYPPTWAGESGVPTADGRVFHNATGMHMKDYRSEVKPVRPAWSNPKKQRGDK